MSNPAPYEGQSVLICGAAGLSGRSLAQLCLRLGARVILSDRAADGGWPASLLDEARRVGSERMIDVRPREDPSLLDEYRPRLILTAPGVPLYGELFTAARQRDIPVRGENDFAAEVIFQYCERDMIPAPLVVAVTGTDGKSTTTAIITHLINQATGLRAVPCGNYGLPLSQLALDSFPVDGPPNLAPVLVVECSSFQLELVQSFHPDVALILNIADDHLDRYPDRDAYLAAKLNVIHCQNERDVLLAPAAILSRIDLASSALAGGARHSGNGSGSGHQAPGDAALPRAFEEAYSDSSEITDRGAYADVGDTLARDSIVQVNRGRPRLVAVATVREEPVPEYIQYRGAAVARSAEFRLPGLHNQENLRFALAALEALEDAAAHYLRGLHVNRQRLAAAIASFRGLPHRMEICPGPQATAAHRGPILFINDSKATTVQAVVAALASFTAPDERVFLLCGGRAKGADFAELGGRANVELLPYGEAGPRIAERAGASSVFAGLQSAFEAACKGAEIYTSEPDRRAIVLLSPGCASYDAYQSYEERGAHFRELVSQVRL